MGKASGTTQVERLQAGILQANEDGVRQGECNGTCATVRRMINDRGLLAELTGKAAIADLTRRYGATYVRTFVDRHQLGGLLEPAAGTIQGPELAEGDANSPGGVGARGEPGGWTGGVVELGDPGDDDGP